MKNTIAVCLVGVAMVGAWTLSQSLNESDDPKQWSIVKQPTNDHFRLDNYGWVVPGGAVVAGFTNKESAIKARDEYRNQRAIKIKKQSAWKVVE